MNVITLTGNAVRDIEIKITGNGKTIANGTIAVKRDFKNPSGEYETDFIDFIALGKTGEIMGNYIKKGDKFGITGRLQIRKWTKDDGTNRYFTEVVVSNFDFPNNGNNQRNNDQSSNQQQTNNDQSYNDPFANGGQTIDILDSDLPF